MYPTDLPGIDELAGQPEVMCRGGSAVISPLGEVVAGPLYDQEGILLVFKSSFVAVQKSQIIWILPQSQIELEDQGAK